METEPFAKIKDYTQTPEVIQSFSPVHLAGMFEIAGGLRFIRRRVGKGKKEHRVASPIMRISDNNVQGIDRLQQLLGGRTELANEESKAWIIERSNAAELAIAMKPFAPSRRTIISAIKQWADFDELPEERIKIADSVAGKYRDKVTAKNYAQLVKNPNFVAGVFDARGSISTTARDNIINLRIVIASQNKALLEALKSHYGFGFVTLAESAGTKKTIKGQPVTRKTDTWQWIIDNEGSNELLNKIGKYIRLRLP